jgi:hypothetical protein
LLFIVVTAAEDKVDRLEARTALLPPEAVELDAQREAVAAVAEPVAQQEAVAEVAEPDGQQEAAVAAAVPVAQREAAVAAAVPDAQQEAAVAVAPDARRAAVAAAAPDAQLEAAVAAVAAVKVRVRPLVASVELAETAAVRLWIRAVVSSAPAREPPVVSAAKEQAAADRRQVACRSLAAAVVRLIPAAAVRPWFRAPSASALGQEESAKEKAVADW